MVNVAEEILIILVFILFLIIAYFFISAFVFERKLRKRMVGVKRLVAGLLLPAFLIPNSSLDELSIEYKNKAIKSYIYLILSFFLAIGLIAFGIEIVNMLDTLAQATNSDTLHGT